MKQSRLHGRIKLNKLDFLLALASLIAAFGSIMFSIGVSIVDAGELASEVMLKTLQSFIFISGGQTLQIATSLICFWGLLLLLVIGGIILAKKGQKDRIPGLVTAFTSGVAICFLLGLAHEFLSGMATGVVSNIWPTLTLLSVLALGVVIIISLVMTLNTNVDVSIKKDKNAPVEINNDNVTGFKAFLLPFTKFKKLFKETDAYGKVAMLFQVILIGSGPLVLGQLELGLLLMVLLYTLSFGFGYISIGFINHTFAISNITFIVVGAILLAAIFALWYVTFSRTITLIEKHNKGEAIFHSFIYNFFAKLILAIIGWFKEFGIQFKVGDKKVKTLLPLSFFSLGIPLIVFGEIVKGIALFVVQILAILYMIARGFVDLQNFIILGQKMRYNSVIVYGVIALVVVALFIYFYILSLKMTLRAAKAYNERRFGTNFKKQLYDIIDKNFYVTALLIPVLGAIIFTIIPLAFMITSAFTNYSNVTAPGYSTTASVHFIEWVGFDAFKRIFADGANLQDLLSVFAWTMIWAVLATFTCFFGGLFLAMLINKKTIKCKALFRSLFVIAMAMPQFVSLLVMRTFFMDQGPLQTVMSHLGWISYDAEMGLWTQEFTARMLIIFINMWVGIPYYMLLTSGLLINIPKGYYEAARIAGASKWQQFKRITFPNIMFMTAPMLITSFVSNINNFNVIYFLTRGEAGTTSISSTAGGTDILITWLYKLTMKTQDYNFGAAIGIIMFAITATLSLVVFRRTSSYKNEEEYR